MAADSPLTPAPPSPAEPPPAVLTWPDVCQWVLGRPTPLWPLLFEQPLLDRAKQLVGRDFSAVVDEVTGLLGAALQVRAQREACWATAHAGLHWSKLCTWRPGLWLWRGLGWEGGGSCINDNHPCHVPAALSTVLPLGIISRFS